MPPLRGTYLLVRSLIMKDFRLQTPLFIRFGCERWSENAVCPGGNIEGYSPSPPPEDTLPGNQRAVLEAHAFHFVSRLVWFDTLDPLFLQRPFFFSIFGGHFSLVVQETWHGAVVTSLDWTEFDRCCSGGCLVNENLISWCLLAERFGSRTLFFGIKGKQTARHLYSGANVGAEERELGKGAFGLCFLAIFNHFTGSF